MNITANKSGVGAIADVPLFFQTAPDLSNDKWVNSLRRMGNELQTLISSTENEFLSIGDKLCGFSLQSREISEISLSAANLMSGEEIVVAIERLREMLDRMSGYIRDSEDELVRSSEILIGVLNILDSVYKPIESFKKIVKVLSVLAISTRIESARLNREGAGFDTLAGDVEKLSILINSKSANIVVQSNSLRILIQQTLSSVLGMKDKQRGQAQVILDSTLSNLTSLTEKHNISSATAREISSRSDEISRNIGQVVTSMQFHDITRQRMEHVKKALHDICEKHKVEFSTDAIYESSDRLKYMNMAGNVCELQAAQVRNTMDELVTAVNGIIESLHNIARNVADMSEETREMAGITGEVGQSFLSEIEDGLSSVMSALSENANAHREMSKTITSVAATVGEISVFVNDIEQIGSEIELIALNARIKAAHTGDEGAAMGVLAEAIQRLSVDARFQTTAVSDTLRKITSAAKELRTDIDSEAAKNGKDAEIEGIARDMEVLLSSLRRMSDRIVSLLSRINEAGRMLTDDINKAVAGISVHNVVADVLIGIISGLERIKADLLDMVPVKTRAESLNSVKELEALYTMHNERKVHLSHTISEPDRASVTTESHISKSSDKAGEGDTEDIGDNVELF